MGYPENCDASLWKNTQHTKQDGYKMIASLAFAFGVRSASAFAADLTRIGIRTTTDIIIQLKVQVYSEV